jgi:myosin heavy subunit
MGGCASFSRALGVSQILVLGADDTTRVHSFALFWAVARNQIHMPTSWQDKIGGRSANHWDSSKDFVVVDTALQFHSLASNVIRLRCRDSHESKLRVPLRTRVISIKDLKEKLKHEKDLGKTKQKEIAAQAKQIKESTKQLANLKAQLTLEKATSKKKDEELATIKQELATLKHELQNAQVPPRQPRLSVLQRSPQFVERRVSDFATSSPSPMQGGDQAQLFQRFLAFEEFNRRNSQGTSRRSSGSSRYMPYGAFN